MARLEWKGNGVLAAILKGAKAGMLVGGEIVLNEANTSMQESPGSGRVYRRRGVEHQASAPGEPPSVDTGRLVQSGSVIPIERGAQVRYDTEYAAPLEFGTQTMEPRPFLFPAAIAKADDVREAVEEAITEAIENA